MKLGRNVIVVTRSARLDNYGDLMSVADLATFLGVSKQTVYNEIREGKFGVPLKFGRTYRIPKVYIAQRYLAGYGGDAGK